MSMKEQILSIAMQDPRFQEKITVIQEQLSGTNMVAEDLTEAIKMLEYVLQNPETYPEVRMAAIKDGLIDEGMFPPQFDEVLIISLLVVLYGMQDRLAQQGYARGGLAVSGKQLARMGQGGDRQLAHINDREAEVLRRMGGQGTVNPNTGLREYKGLKNILKVALPLAVSFIAPVVAPAIGAAVLAPAASTLPALAGSALAQGVVGGAILGGGSSLLTGGNPLSGAIRGGLGAFAPMVSEGIQAFAPNLDPQMVSALGSGVTGAVGESITGGDAGAGFTSGVLSSMFRPQVTNMTQRASKFAVDNLRSKNPFTGPSDDIFTEMGQTDVFTPSGPVRQTQRPTTALDRIYSRAQEGLNEMTAGVSPEMRGSFQQEIMQNAKLRNMQRGETAFNEMITGEAPYNPVDPKQVVAERGKSALDRYALEKAGPANLMSAEATAPSSGFNLKGNIAPLLLAGASLSGLNSASVQAIQQADQSGIFDRSIDEYDYIKIQNDANSRGMTVFDFLNSVSFRDNQSAYYKTPTRMAARGGIMDAPGYVSGPGDGRDDVINARLSDGEYVIDAESVSLLGNGSNEAGAEMLDDMRKKLRMHKGKVLAKGKFSPDAKSPLEYMRRSA